jgi:hypothetical protein
MQPKIDHQKSKKSNKYPILAMDSVHRRTPEPSEHYYLSHATFSFPSDRLLSQTMVISADRRVYMRHENVSKEPALVLCQ